MQRHTHREGVAFHHWLTDYCIDKPDREIVYLQQIAMTIANSQRTKKQGSLPLDRFTVTIKRKPKPKTQAELDWDTECAMAAWAVRLGFDMDGKPAAYNQRIKRK